ncbi:MAG: hypothetical protein Ct9H300mP25_11710 [Acidobacteriota bacterium]|nr:MAG: hypothetical protein Ct9H300mP25_11710 [Acidobacteriota bacterium]
MNTIDYEFTAYDRNRLPVPGRSLPIARPGPSFEKPATKATTACPHPEGARAQERPGNPDSINPQVTRLKPSRMPRSPSIDPSRFPD